MKCKRCGHPHVNVQMVAEQKKRGCLAVCGWMLLAFMTCGLVLLIPALTKKGTKTRKYAVCPNCGYSWRI